MQGRERYGNQFRRIILGDLMRISLVAAGVHWDDASGGMDRASLDAHFAEALDEYDHYVELRREGTSTKWDSNTSSDITALMDEAEAKMLSLSAPTLAAVEKKLTALWLDDRYDPIVNSTAHVTILRDIRRLLANDIE